MNTFSLKRVGGTVLGVVAILGWVLFLTYPAASMLLKGGEGLPYGIFITVFLVSLLIIMVTSYFLYRQNFKGVIVSFVVLTLILLVGPFGF